jgi:hypothetical protein
MVTFVASLFKDATFFTALCSAVLAAFLVPLFQHRVWRKQKLREQRISVAERFAAMHSNFLLATSLTPSLQSNDKPALQDASKFLEQEALLILIQILFDREDTIRACNNLKALLNKQPPQLSEDSLRELWRMRIDLLSRLFAEAFEVSTERLSKRALKNSHVH